MHPSPNVSSQSRILAPKWGTHHFWEIHICRAAPLSINAILPICEGLVAARMTLCAVVNTSHPHIPETHQESRMKAFVGWRLIKDFGLEMRCGRVRLTLFFPLHNSNFLYRIENVVCYPFRTATLVDNETIEGQIGEGCWLPCSGHTISSTGPSVSPFRDFLASIQCPSLNSVCL